MTNEHTIKLMLSLLPPDAEVQNPVAVEALDDIAKTIEDAGPWAPHTCPLDWWWDEGDHWTIWQLRRIGEDLRDRGLHEPFRHIFAPNGHVTLIDAVKQFYCGGSK